VINNSHNSSQKPVDTQEGYAHAAPLAPLRERDWTEIELLFDRQDSDEIEADVINKLGMLHPEPCWDEDPYCGEDPYEFLSEYL
jgi:hypothetical protein